MFPNYCFTKSNRHFGCDVLRRNYIVQDSKPQRSSGHLTARDKSKVRTADTVLKRTKRHRKRTSSVASSTPKETKDSSSCNVSYRLKSRELAGKNRLQSPKNRQTESASKSNMHSEPSCNPHCDLQDSFADFFSIIHDNVMESVKEGVQGLVAQYFAESMAKMERLSKEVLKQEGLLKKIYSDVTNKISAQSETNMNQFKFVTQMLIDNQTVHYRALNQAKQNRLRRLEERELEKKRKLEWERKRSGSTTKSRSSSMDPNKRSVGGDGKQAQSRGLQHKLCQQQQPTIYQMGHGANRMPQSSSMQATTHRIQKRSTSYSLPNLCGRTPLVSNRLSPSGVSQVSGSHPYSNQQDRVICLPAMTYPPRARRGSVPRRRFHQTVKTIIGQADVKGKK